MTEQQIDASTMRNITRHVAAADYYSLLALLFQIPKPETTSMLLDERLIEDYRVILSEMDGACAEFEDLASRFVAMQRELAGESDSLSVIRQEYTRAFAHPRRPPIKLYEGLFVDDERERAGKEISYARLFVSPAAMDAERQYARAGVRCDNAEKRISADCITTELQFMSHLHTLMAKALVERDGDGFIQAAEWINDFKEKHVRQWMPRFFERCAEETQHDFYRLAGEMGLVLMKLDFTDAGCD